MRKIIPVFAVVLGLVGCQAKLNHSSTVEVELADKQSKIVEAISKEQTIKVAGNASSGQFNLYVFLQKDQTAAENDIDRGSKNSPLILAQKVRTNQAEVTALIPANQVAVVMLTSGDGKKATVNLKITN